VTKQDAANAEIALLQFATDRFSAENFVNDYQVLAIADLGFSLSANYNQKSK
jgi:hypothetical protein